MPSTTDLILAWDRRRPRSKQQELGMSDLGGCRRRAGYSLAGQKPTNPGGSVQAAMGSAIHDAIADILTELGIPGASHEKEVKFAGLIGHYAGTPIRTVRIDYLARDTGEEWTWHGLFDPRNVRDAVEWLRLVRTTELEMLPRDYEPDSAFCRGCKFLQVCWQGAVADRDPLSVLFVEDPDAEKWAAELWSAREQIKELKVQEKRAKGALDALRPPEGMGRVQCGPYTIDFRSNGVYFVAGSAPVPAVGYEDGEAA
jgi:hypothetical protein